MHYYFHDGRVLLTQAFAAGITASTVDDGGHPRGSTELNDETRHNCWMTHKEFQEFEYLIFGLDSDSSIATSKHSQGFKQTDYSFLNMMFGDFTTITNLHPVITQEIKGDCHSLTQALTQCTLLLIGADVLTPLIIEPVWGANKIIWRNLGGPHVDLALIRRCLISLSAVAINAFHLWTTLITTTHKSLLLMPSDSIHLVSAQSSTQLHNHLLPHMSVNLSLLAQTKSTFYSTTYASQPTLQAPPLKTW
jgi:hypothetical protein